MNRTIIVVHSPLKGWGVIWEKLTFSQLYMKAEELSADKAKKYIREHGLVKVYKSADGVVYDVADEKERYRKEAMPQVVKERKEDEKRGGKISEEFKEGVKVNAMFFDLREVDNKTRALANKLKTLAVGQAIYINLKHCCVATARGAAWKYKEKGINIKTFTDGGLCYLIKEEKK